DALRLRSEELEALGVTVMLGVEAVPGCYDLAVVSPGIPPHARLMRSARDHAGELVSELEFAYRRSTASWLAVTGTNGKTTVTTLIGHLLTTAGRSAAVVGNIGTPAISAVDRMERDGMFVAEVSSFQLALTRDFHPRVSVLLNVTPDHLDWHGSMEEYAAAKARVFARQGPGDVAVIDGDDDGAARFLEPVRRQGVEVAEVTLSRRVPGGAGLDSDGMLTLHTGDGPVTLVHRDSLPVRGDHNVRNVLAAARATHALGVGHEALRAGLVSFRPLGHRLEPVRTVDGIAFVNDSKATNPDAAVKALRSFAGRPVTVLLGGRNKGSRFSDVSTALADTGARAVLFGEAADEIARDIEGSGAPFERAGTLSEAFRLALRETAPGGVVLLSPGCASFDEFSGYAERGEAFRRLVEGVSGG
ncbi:MAG TPA: UDP-N-acetylmuramoyl-L-alanine--D-glutamate ligase, partial [Coriobacteriia bacterium]|nr:UDP-N-acetylmuramoyl-L-alanine--D-glutamate ligase [Coriobacteriia bacterium]